ncbi:MAG: hypothetical protein ABIF10_08270 [Candidatus Woesearchaeota archaeon]
MPVAYSPFVSPGKYQFDFVPNLEKDLHFLVGGSGRVNVTLSGGIAQYAQVTNMQWVDRPGSLSGWLVTVHMKLPEFIETPGRNEMDLRVMEVSDDGSMISAAAGVIAPIYVFVPYPGIYVITSFAAPSVNENETVDFVVTASNYGYENISSAYAEIDVLDSSGDLLTSLKTQSSALLSRMTYKEFNASWPTVGYPVGPYSANARFYYRDNVSSMSSSFNIGYLVVNILNYSRTVQANSISPFDVTIQSGWNSPIDNVYAVVELEGKSFQSPSVNLKPWEKATVKCYVDTNEILPGKYKFVISVHYKGSSNQLDSEIEVLSPEKPGFLESPVWIIGTVTVLSLILIALVVLTIILVSKRKRRK